MKKTTVVIVEDEPIIADDLALTLADLGYEVCAIADNSEDALTQMDTHQPSIALLDIMIKGDLDGIQLAHRINEKFSIPFIFMTSLFDNTTITRAKHTQPAGYIVKPFKETDLKINMELALMKSKAPTPPPPNDDLNLFVRKAGTMVSLEFENINYVEADDNYSILHEEKDKHVVSHTLKEIEHKLSAHGFCRIHKTFLVNLHQIDRIEQSVLFIKDQMLPIGKAYRKAFFNRLTVL